MLMQVDGSQHALPRDRGRRSLQTVMTIIVYFFSLDVSQSVMRLVKMKVRELLLDTPNF